jgi:cardiolipin synthase A/B
MKLMIEPDDGAELLLAAIRAAKKSIEIVIFRFDSAEIEAALKAAVGRGVAVSALIAYTNRGGELNLRKLEMRLLEVGVAVSRTASDLTRYHDKLVIIDRRVLFVLSFNFTHLDIDHSRGFGIMTRNSRLVQEAARLFEADTTRKPFTSGLSTFVVSPVNSRRALSDFIKGAKKQLLIYDPKITDVVMLRLLGERKRAGVEIKVIGRVSRRNPGLESRRLSKIRLHTRTIIRDRTQAFLGSQSLRAAELDSRREVGVILREQQILAGLLETFEADWLASAVAVGKPAVARAKANAKALKQVSKGLVKELSTLSPLVKEALKEAKAESGGAALSAQETKDSVKEAVKQAVKEAVKARVETVVQKSEVQRDKAEAADQKAQAADRKLDAKPHAA